MPGFEALIHRFERSISVLGRSPNTFKNYSMHVASIALYYGKIPTELDSEQIYEYLFMLQKRSKTPSQTYFKHTVYGLRFLLKSEGLPYSYLHLPAIQKEQKLPIVLSKQEVWAMLKVGTPTRLYFAQTQGANRSSLRLRTALFGSSECKIGRFRL